MGIQKPARILLRFEFSLIHRFQRDPDEISQTFRISNDFINNPENLTEESLNFSDIRLKFPLIRYKS